MIKNKKRKRKNPIDIGDLKLKKMVYYKNKPFLVSKIRLGGTVDIISEDGNTKYTSVKMSDLTLQSKEQFKEIYGFSKLDEPVYVLLDRYIIKDNLKLRSNETYLDFMVYRKLNADKNPIPGLGWMFDATIESLKTKQPILVISSPVGTSYNRRGEAFSAAQRMIQAKAGILVPNSLIPIEENKLVKI